MSSNTSTETPEEGKPDKRKYGWVDVNSHEEEGGWMIEGGEDAYELALNRWEKKRLASLERENAELKAINTELDKSVTKWRDAFFAVSDSVKQMQLDLSTAREGWKMHFDSQAETIKRYKNALSRCSECNDLATAREYATSALSGTNE